MTVIGWVGFAGAWLLVAGPLYQGVLELLEQELDQAGFEAATAGLTPPRMPSPWWWLLPPVMFVLQQRRTADFRREAIARLTTQQRTQYTGFMQKATGWFVVATGASLLAVKETWEIAEQGDWPGWVFWVVLAVMFILVVGNATYAMTTRRRAAGLPALGGDRPGGRALGQQSADARDQRQ